MKFCLPDLGEGLAEAELVAWQVGEGDHVVVDQPLLSVETAKAIVDVPAPCSGKIVRLCAKPGDIVPLGGELVEIDDGQIDDTGTVVGDAPAPRAAAAEPARVEPVAAAGAGSRVELAISPAVRALANELGVPLDGLIGSGPEGSITRADLEAAALARQPVVAAPLPAAEPLRGPRRAMAQNMARSHAQVASVLLVEDADIQRWSPHEDTTWRLVRAMVGACQAVPALNAWFDGETLSRRLFRSVNLGIAVNIADALYVPVLEDAAHYNRASLRVCLEALKARVKARSLKPEELRGQSITLSNFGMFAGRYASPIIVPPTVAIVGAGRARYEPVAVEGMLAVHRRLPISLCFDHRAVTGAEAAGFLAALLADLGRAD